MRGLSVNSICSRSTGKMSKRPTLYSLLFTLYAPSPEKNRRTCAGYTTHIPHKNRHARQV
jgi:hypothetical protein